MSKETNYQVAQIVYVVTCFQSIVGVYASQDDASQMQRELIQKNRPADVLCRSVIPSSIQ